jgi:hypothetical protein
MTSWMAIRTSLTASCRTIVKPVSRVEREPAMPRLPFDSEMTHPLYAAPIHLGRDSALDRRILQ